MSDLAKFKGGKELQQFLSQLPAKLEQNVMRSALRAGAKVVLNEAKDNVPVQDGRLRDSLKLSVRAKRGTVTAKVSTKLFYARFVEFGTAVHLIKPRKAKALSIGSSLRETVEHPGAQAKPFLRPALDGKAGEALVAVGNQIRKRLTKEGINAAGIELESE